MTAWSWAEQGHKQETCQSGWVNVHGASMLHYETQAAEDQEWEKEPSTVKSTPTGHPVLNGQLWKHTYKQQYTGQTTDI